MSTRELLKSLYKVIEPARVLTAKEDLLCYAYDATADLPQQLPDVVVFPGSTAEVVEIVRLAGEHSLPIYPRGSGTNLSGGTIPTNGGIVLCTLEMNNILEIDAENLTAIVQPGVIIQDLNDAAALYGLIYPPDPGTVATATMGGSVAECSGGLRGLKYGVTKHYVMGLQVVLADGKVLRLGGKTVKNVSGYDLVKLFTGSEGTLGIITEIIVKLIPAPEDKRSLLAIFREIGSAARTITGIIDKKVIPSTLEIMDNATVRAVEDFATVGLPVEAAAILLIEVDGITETVIKEAEVVAKVCRENGGELRIAKDDDERDKLWAARRAALPALAQIRPTTVLEDATVPRSRIPEMLAALAEIAEKYSLKICTFGHAGDGNLHPTIITDQRDAEEMARVHTAIEEIFQVAVSLGGTLSGEHGIGLSKKKYLELEFGTEGVEVLRKIKKALDPTGLLNPGKIVS